MCPHVVVGLSEFGVDILFCGHSTKGGASKEVEKIIFCFGGEKCDSEIVCTHIENKRGITKLNYLIPEGKFLGA